jgi:hypothetical protein
VNVEACRSCHAPVIWAAHARTGRPAPLDAEPGGAGNCVLTEGRYTVLGKAEDRMLAVLEGTELRTNHFQTCPDAKGWKKS